MKKAFTIISSLEKRLHQTSWVSPESLSLYRIIFCLSALFFGFPAFAWIGEVPATLFVPPRFSLASLFSTFPPPIVFRSIDILISILLVFLLFGYRTRPTAIALSLLLIFGRSFQYSMGKIDHQILVDLTPLFLAFSSWGQRYSIDALRTPNIPHPPESRDKATGLSLLTLCICFGFFSAGLPKLLSWVDFDLQTQGARVWLVRLPDSGILGPFLLGIRSPLFWEIADYLAVIFEVGFLFAWLNRKCFRLFLCAAVLFHFSNWIMMGIGFATFMIIYGAFVEWRWIKDQLILPQLKWRRSSIMTLFILCLVAHVTWTSIQLEDSATLNGIFQLWFSSKTLVGIQLLFALAVVILYFTWLGRSMVKRLKS